MYLAKKVNFTCLLNHSNIIRLSIASSQNTNQLHLDPFINANPQDVKRAKIPVWNELIFHASMPKLPNYPVILNTARLWHYFIPSAQPDHPKRFKQFGLHLFWKRLFTQRSPITPSDPTHTSKCSMSFIFDAGCVYCGGKLPPDASSRRAVFVCFPSDSGAVHQSNRMPLIALLTSGGHKVTTLGAQLILFPFVPLDAALFGLSWASQESRLLAYSSPRTKKYDQSEPQSEAKKIIL